MNTLTFIKPNLLAGSNIILITSKIFLSKITSYNYFIYRTTHGNYAMSKQMYKVNGDRWITADYIYIGMVKQLKLAKEKLNKLHAKEIQFI